MEMMNKRMMEEKVKNGRKEGKMEGRREKGQ